MKKICVNGHTVIKRTKKNQCWKCYQIYQAKIQRRMQQRIRDFINEFKIDSGCAKCGYNLNHAALQLDHIIPRKDSKKRWTGPKWWKQAEELISDPNIQVLCANCHAIKTRENLDYKERP